MEKEFRHAHTFRPVLGPPPLPSIGTLVQVSILRFSTNVIDYNPTLSGQAEDDEEPTFSVTGDSQHVWSDGCIVGTHGDGTVEVKLEENAEVVRVPANRMRVRLPDSALGLEQRSPNKGEETTNRLGDLNTTGRTESFSSVSPIKSSVRRKDFRNSEQRQLDESCSFQPRLMTSNPFISDRRLKELQAEEAGEPLVRRSRYRQQPSGSGSYSPGIKSSDAAYAYSPYSGQHYSHFRTQGDGEDDDSTIAEGTGARAGVSKPRALGGMFVPGEAFKIAPPPEAGLPMFYFDPSRPPSFAAGTYFSPMASASRSSDGLVSGNVSINSTSTPGGKKHPSPPPSPSRRPPPPAPPDGGREVKMSGGGSGGGGGGGGGEMIYISTDGIPIAPAMPDWVRF